MATVMLIAKPKGTGSEFAGLPLKNLTSGVLELADGTSVAVDNDIFTNVTVDMEVVVDGKHYIVEKSGAITPGMGKIILREM